MGRWQSVKASQRKNCFDRITVEVAKMTLTMVIAAVPCATALAHPATASAVYHEVVHFLFTYFNFVHHKLHNDNTKPQLHDALDSNTPSNICNHFI